jgi:AcrR family transcriptional regulator
MSAQAQVKLAPQTAEDSAKRRQIVQGARTIFLERGFDAASMSDIARAAGVSKGTLYVYFADKEQLFEAIVREECLCQPEKASALRTVVAIADRMPEIGKVFYETGPAVGIAKLADYLRAQTQAGVLTVEDCELAAAQFMDACKSTLFMPVMFNFREAPALGQITYVVGVAVKTFLAAYQVTTR